ncbi:MAG: DUF4097 family beta strand repeat-containing protein [Verrucomicrobiia bacterium]|jgi:hypothetical protein
MKTKLQSQLLLGGMAGLLVLGAISCGDNTSVSCTPLRVFNNLNQATEERHLTLPHVANSGLEVRTSFGSISVVADPALTNVEVTAKLVAGGYTTEAAMTNLTKIAVKTKRRPDNILEIWAEFPEGSTSSESFPFEVHIPFFHVSRSSRGSGCSFEVRIPEAQGVKAKTSHGAVTLKGLSGTAEVETTFGGVTVTEHRGPVEARTSNGPVHLENVEGTVHARTTFGRVTVHGVRGKVEATNSNGGIEVAEVTESVQVTTTFGSVTVREAGGNVTVEDSNGTIKVENAKGNVRAGTTFGSVTVREAGGEADLRSSNGSITYAPATGNENRFDLRTTFGKVEVRLPASAKGKVQAETSFGNIKVDGTRQPLSVTGDKTHKQIVLTETGPESRINTSHGSIHISLE